MFRTAILSLAALAAAGAIVSCATDDDRRIRAAQEATCRTPESTEQDPDYDGACMRRVAEQIQAARSYRPSTRPPKAKGK